MNGKNIQSMRNLPFSVACKQLTLCIAPKDQILIRLSLRAHNIMQISAWQCHGQGGGANQDIPGMAVGGRLPRLVAAPHAGVLVPCTLPAASPMAPFLIAPVNFTNILYYIYVIAYPSSHQPSTCIVVQSRAACIRVARKQVICRAIL